MADSKKRKRSLDDIKPRKKKKETKTLKDHASEKKETKTLYHHTTREAARQILKTGQIKESTDREKDAAYGPGTYLTGLGPGRSRSEIARNNFDGYKNRLADQKMKEGKTEVAIAVDVPKNQFFKAKSDRNIYVAKGDVSIEDKNPSVYVRDKSGKARLYKPKK
ncbi:uncharacterized protein LOC110441095 [Mizuhopecten yessoensis]|uniref:Tox-ART-HYD1 domain-containing protein n=1 Tax=Mizuhopecten yessoensis TaxID=6573 RepID=A0A210PJZ4_MIZYE|nr:uncharacterized protein LOC110441095 [Mizuhopecten yessoensis]OWF36818.1 hypothetical protein KP79_PYT02819 [Mizuhopecten yessoensis]